MSYSRTSSKAAATRTSTKTAAASRSNAPPATATATAGSVPLAPAQYSGSGSARDPCSRGLAALYPFGAAGGDSVLTRADDGSSPLALSTPLKVFGVSYSTIYPSTNGAIFLGAGAPSYQSPGFPTSSLSAPVIAPWLADGNTLASVPAIAGYSNAQPNNVYMRVSSAAADIARMSSDVATAFPSLSPAFAPSSVAVVTWFAVGYYASGASPNAAADKLNTFQATLASDGSGRSFVTMW
jgi:hypothetical protein